MEVGSPGDVCGVQLTILPPVEELQTDPQTRAKWIDYSAFDAKATWQLAQALKKQLMVGTVVYTHALVSLICVALLRPDCTGQRCDTLLAGNCVLQRL